MCIYGIYIFVLVNCNVFYLILTNTVTLPLGFRSLEEAGPLIGNFSKNAGNSNDNAAKQY